MAFNPDIIQSINGFYSEHYLLALLDKDEDMRALFERWDADPVSPAKQLEGLRRTYFAAKSKLHEASDTATQTGIATGWHRAILNALGFETTAEQLTLDDQTEVAIATSVEQNGTPRIVVLDAGWQPTSADPTPLLERSAAAAFLTGTKAHCDTLGTLVSAIYRNQEAPRWILLLGGDHILLIDQRKYFLGQWLHIDLDTAYGAQVANAPLREPAAMLARECLAPYSGTSIHDGIDDRSHRHAYSVSDDLKDSLREAIEILANEYLWWRRNVDRSAVFTTDILATLPNDLKEECLRWLYKLLFLFYVEARGGELDIVPMRQDCYRLGYSLEALRDLELVTLTTPEAQNGTFIHDSLNKLFDLVQNGTRKSSGLDLSDGAGAFAIHGLNAPLFDASRVTPLLAKARFRNAALQKILQLLSLSRTRKNHSRGRVSYAQLGINQLGSVYEGILSYTGFFAAERLYGIRRADKSDDPIFYIGESETHRYETAEFVMVDDPDQPGKSKRLVHEKGAYVLHLAGRDRERSASFYTPEVLTREVVLRTLNERIVTTTTADEILTLKVLEPAMGSGAFLNEAITQLADAYLARKQRETKQLIPAEQIHHERQRVKEWLARHNVYGVDLNPIAVELARVSLWLGTMHEGSSAPWFGLRLADGNSLVGCKRAIYTFSEITSGGFRDSAPTLLPMGPTWQTVPAGAVYHFLLPFDGMVDMRNDVVKDHLPAETAKVRSWRKEFVSQKWVKDNAKRLHEMTLRIDALWKVVSTERANAVAKCSTPRTFWPYNETADPLSIGSQEQIAAELEEPFHAYPRLKLIMDAWCALWFLPPADWNTLPSPDEWLERIDAILTGTLFVNDLFEVDAGDPDGVDTDYERDFVSRHGWIDTAKLKREIPFLRAADTCAARHRFHHYMLRFAEVFTERGGFDVLLGNPPWLKVSWDESGVLGEYDPMIVMKDLSATDVVAERNRILERPGALAAYIDEACATLAFREFANGVVSYAILKGTQTNLYKMFVVQAWELLSGIGFAGLLHPEGMYDDSKGQAARREVYKRLRFHAHFQNELLLFEDVGHTRPYGFSIYGPEQSPNFKSICNLYHPRTIQACLDHDGFGNVPGMKDANGRWNTSGHASRMLTVTERELAIMAQIEGTPDVLGTKLLAAHSTEALTVLAKLSAQPRRASDVDPNYEVSRCFDESIDQKKGYFVKAPADIATIDNIVLCGPNILIGNPGGQNSGPEAKTNLDYVSTDWELVSNDFVANAKYRVTEKGRAAVDTASQQFKIAHRMMLAITGVRSLIPAVVHPETMHIHGVSTTRLSKHSDLLVIAALAFSIVADYGVRVVNKTNLNDFLPYIPFPAADSPWLYPLAMVALRMNCVTSHYAPLWEEVTAHHGIKSEWSRDHAPRTDRARRALEIDCDALATLAYGLTADELCAIYTTQFAVLQGYERSNRYDANGRLLPGAVQRLATKLGWHTGTLPPPPKQDGTPGADPWVVDHILSNGENIGAIRWQDPKLFPLVERTYVPPFTTNDREADMRKAIERWQAWLDSGVPKELPFGDRS